MAFDHVELKDAKACPLIHSMASRPTNLHRSVILIRYDNDCGIVCIRHDMRRRSANPE